MRLKQFNNILFSFSQITIFLNSNMFTEYVKTYPPVYVSNKVMKMSSFKTTVAEFFTFYIT